MNFDVCRFVGMFLRSLGLWTVGLASLTGRFASTFVSFLTLGSSFSWAPSPLSSSPSQKSTETP